MRRTPLYERHVALGAKIVEFGGWDMPLQYPAGIVEEHLATRRSAGLFDVSHMGRFRARGRGALAFLQHALSGNAAALSPGQAQYTMIPDERGGARDDAYLYCLAGEDYLLVVNAGNLAADWDYLRGLAVGFPGAELTDSSEELAMLSLQGPRSPELAEALLGRGALPPEGRNRLRTAPARGLDGAVVVTASTGYAGEALGFELFLPAVSAVRAWDRLLELGTVPVGLGARDTLRLEAGLPLYGHELGTDAEGNPIPVFACPLARFGVSLDPAKGAFVGREALARQWAALQGFRRGDFSRLADLPRRGRLLQLLDPGVARPGHTVLREGRGIGGVTSGTVVPYWEPAGTAGRRAVALALLASDTPEGAVVQVDIRGRKAEARLVPRLLDGSRPPHTQPVLWGRL